MAEPHAVDVERMLAHADASPDERQLVGPGKLCGDKWDACVYPCRCAAGKKGARADGAPLFRFSSWAPAPFLPDTDVEMTPLRTFAAAPPDVLFHVFKHLPPEALGAAREVCREWARHGADSRLWVRLGLRRWLAPLHDPYMHVLASIGTSLDGTGPAARAIFRTFAFRVRTKCGCTASLSTRHLGGPPIRGLFEGGPTLQLRREFMWPCFMREEDVVGASVLYVDETPGYVFCRMLHKHLDGRLGVSVAAGKGVSVLLLQRGGIVAKWLGYDGDAIIALARADPPISWT